MIIGLIVAQGIEFTLYHQTRKDGFTIPKPADVNIVASTLRGAKEDLLGSPDSPYTLVEFGDYECPPCAKRVPEVHPLLSR